MSTAYEALAGLKDIADRFQRNERLTGPGWAAEIHIALAEVDAATTAAKAEGWNRGVIDANLTAQDGKSRDNPFRASIEQTEAE